RATSSCRCLDLIRSAAWTRASWRFVTGIASAAALHCRLAEPYGLPNDDGFLMTFSIVARDPDTGDLGVAVASKFLAVGSVVSHAQAGIGAVATQALANYTYGTDGLAQLRAGASAEETVRLLTQADDGRDQRQLGIVDANGGAATYTGSGCIDWAGGRTAHGVGGQGTHPTGRTGVS